MRRSGAWWSKVVALALAGAAAPLFAQSANDFRLPTPTSSPSRAQGPVDNEVPVVRRTETTPRAEPAPVAPPSAAPTPTPVPATRAPAQPTRPRVAVPVPSRAAPAIAPASLPSAPVAEPVAATPPFGPEPSPAPTQATAPLPGPSGPTLPAWWPIAAGGAALLVLAGALVAWLRRRREAEPEIAFESPVVAAPEPEPAPPPRAVPAPAPAPIPAPRPHSDLTMVLEARRLNASLMATTLSYGLTITNHGKHALAALAIEGDMVSAHASIPPEQQIASNDRKLELRHAMITLNPGESAVFTGDFRLPLSEVTPIRAGEAAYFVPLARFRVEAGGLAEAAAQTFVIGELPAVEGAALKPFRLDLGPRTFSRIGQRAVN